MGFLPIRSEALPIGIESIVPTMVGTDIINPISTIDTPFVLKKIGRNKKNVDETIVLTTTAKHRK
jgi:hypothetical protein